MSQDNIHDFSIPVKTFEQLANRRADLTNRQASFTSLLSQKKDRLPQLAQLQEWQKSANSLESWISEKILQAEKAIETDASETNSTEILQLKLQTTVATEAEIEKHEQRLINLENDTNVVFPNLTLIKESETLETQEKVGELKLLWEKLKNLLESRRLNLNRQFTLLRYNRLLSDFTANIDEKIKDAGNEEIGSDLEECKKITYSFEKLKNEANLLTEDLQEIESIATGFLEQPFNQNTEAAEHVESSTQEAKAKLDGLKKRDSSETR